jgi:hypothetical protein
MDTRTVRLRTACIAINDAAQARDAARELRRQRRLAAQNESQDSAANQSDDSDTGDEGGLMRHKITTYFPPTYTDRTSLADEWRRLETERKAKALAAAEDELRSQPAFTNTVGWVSRRKRTAVPNEQTVPEMLEQQRRMAYEADVIERMRQQAEREHVKLLGRTPDVASGRMDALLAETRRLTENPNP